MKIYTKTGDRGTTSLVGGTRVAKTHVRLEAYGTIDELTAQLGLLSTYLTGLSAAADIRWIQQKLFTIGSLLATETDSPLWEKLPQLAESDTARLESLIDEAQSGLPALHDFILPGGSRRSALCHVCRTVCRRAERRVLAMEEEGVEISDEVKSFLNRLSDYLFVLSRIMNSVDGHSDFFLNNACD